MSMTTQTPRLLSVSLAAALAALPVRGAGAEGPVLEDELAQLAQSTTRLVDLLERQERSRAAAEELEKLRVAVTILEMRARRNEGLQRELRDAEDREQSTLEAIATAESRLEANRDEQTKTTDEESLGELRQRGVNLGIQIAGLKTRIEHVQARQVDLRNRILEQDRGIVDLEAVVDDWLGSLKLGSK